uniref:Uncharacterized protein n=1 Tax=Strombidium inclinatum TaxID=197538 RepID=A0A7S3IN75_9SPIT|mmetsp:Transcript_2785/g.4365  ORF Transcript_2785/g.4365 Transcript_2785/m.4365 type:complete len:332 (+) Transcript_2785:21-1016(+)
MQSFCAALGFLGYSCAPEDAALHQKFVEHMSVYGLSYGTSEEMKFRFEQFMRTENQINESNANPEHTFVSGHNKFSTWTQDEFKKMLGKKPELATKAKKYAPVTDEAVPDSVDWRQEEDIVSPIQDQGQCGSCWAFSTTAAVESAHALKTKKANGKATLLKLSEQQLVDCTPGCLGCFGGLEATAMDYLETAAQDLETDYPYTARWGTCEVSKNDAKGKVMVTDHQAIVDDKVLPLKQAIAKAPTCVSIDAESNLQSYTGGIFNPKSGCSGTPNHAVTAVGYGSEGNQEYYIIRNSWGTSWGEDGYFRAAIIGDGDGTCEIQTDSNTVQTD